MKDKLLKIFLDLIVIICIPFYLAYKIVKFLVKSVFSFSKNRFENFKNRKNRNVYYTEDGIKLKNSTMTRREKFIVFITLISTSAFFLMALAAAITLL